MDISNIKQIQKLTYIVNTMLAAFVGSVSIIYKIIGLDVLFYFTLCALAVYMVEYVIIAMKRVDIYLFSVYGVITVFMFVNTIYLGIKPGFQMYVLSMIPLFYFCDYFGENLGTKRGKPFIVSIIISATYVISTAYSLINGPIYALDTKIEVSFFAVNSLWVIFLLILYSASMINMVRTSEEKLRKMAQIDKLTNLYNRHFMIDRLEEIHDSKSSARWIAMLDIDNFKHINDTYGHNVGDLVLVKVSDAIRNVCGRCVYARWGGEEFLITSDTSNDPKVILEQLRKTIDETSIPVDGEDIHVSITVGACICDDSETVDLWIQHADSLLYKGKNNGKNQVVFE